MDTKWMNGKFVLPAAMAMSLGLIGCSESSEGASSDDAAAAVTEHADDAAATTEDHAEHTDAATDSGTNAVDDAAASVGDAAEAVESAVENADDPTGGP